MTNVVAWDEYYGRLSAGWAWKDGADPFLQLAVDRALGGLPAPHRIVEVGCGDGRNVPMLVSRSPHDVWVSDISTKALERLDFNLSPAVRQALAEVACRDVYETGYSTGFFDVAVCTLLFDHLQDVGRATMELSRILKPGGCLIAQFSSVDDDAFLISEPTGSDVKRRQLHGLPFRFFERADIETHLRPDFSRVQISKVAVLDPPHPGWREEVHQHIYWLAIAHK